MLAPQLARALRSPASPSLIGFNPTGTYKITGNASQTVNLPTSFAPGDTLILIGSNSGGNTLTLPAGWIPIMDALATTRLAVWAKIADGADGATLAATVSSTNPTGWLAFTRQGRRGLEDIRPVWNSSDGNIPTPDAPGLRDGSVAFSFYTGSGNVSQGNTPPANWTLDVNYGATSGGDQAGVGLCVAHKTVRAGPIGTISWGSPSFPWKTIAATMVIPAA